MIASHDDQVLHSFLPTIFKKIQSSQAAAAAFHKQKFQGGNHTRTGGGFKRPHSSSSTKDDLDQSKLRIFLIPVNHCPNFHTGVYKDPQSSFFYVFIAF
jgi:hypothetical protein